MLFFSSQSFPIDYDSDFGGVKGAICSKIQWSNLGRGTFVLPLLRSDGSNWDRL